MNRHSRRAFAAKAEKFMRSDTDCAKHVDLAATGLKKIPGFDGVSFSDRREIIIDLRAQAAGTFAPVEGPPVGCQLVDRFGLPLLDDVYRDALRRVRAKKHRSMINGC